MQMQRSAKRAYGSGSIFERNGDWYGKWRVNGRQVKRKLGPKRTRGEADGLTRTQAEARLRDLIAATDVDDIGHAAASTARRPGVYTIKELGDLYVAYARDHKGLKAGTVTEYESIVRVHLAPYFGETTIQRIDGRQVEAFALFLRRKKGGGRRGGGSLAPKTIENVLGALAVLFNFAVRKKWLVVSPMAAADLPKLADGDKPIDELTFLEPAEVERLIEAARPGAYNTLDRALYAMAAFTGLRQGELRGLLWKHIDFGQSKIQVLENITRGRRSSPKGKRRRSVPLAPTAAQLLLTLRAGSKWTRPGDPVFACPSTGEPMSRTQLMKRYREALETARLDPGFSFHDLRHTFGTTMARAGVPVGTIQAWMGHADLQTTQIYMHYAPAADDAARIEAAFGLSTNPGTNLSVTDRTEGTSQAA